ncbi:MAG TPA: hypothetical protein VIK28_08325, partial [Sedimentisphaerales bacterium]
TFTITTIDTAVDVSVSDDDPNALAIPSRDSSIAITIPEGEKNEEIRDNSNRGYSARRKSARRMRASRPSKRKSNRSGG